MNDVTNVRELRDGVQARVRIGTTKLGGLVEVTITARSSGVLAAMGLLRSAIYAEADAAVREAQESRTKRGVKALGA